MKEHGNIKFRFPDFDFPAALAVRKQAGKPMKQRGNIKIETLGFDFPSSGRRRLPC
ncbi:MAG: hypothetical protein OXE57_12105 [Alphaproteobacteria bacterium]|nr:hypothetical protein [Alphaproteobacteria bacterium]